MNINLPKPLRKRFLPKCIRLAVVGNASSGKSFLLKDIIDALRSMNCAFYTSESLESEDGFQYKPFSNYAPNQKGSGGQTPLYACRHEDHYGQLVKGPDFKFDLSFLNIPGEIFREDMLQCYIELKGQLSAKKKLFTVHTYVNPAGETRWIVKPNAKVCKLEEDQTVTAPSSSGKDAYLQRFKPWGEIYRELDVARFKDQGQKDIRGDELMLNFFKYDTDSVMRSIYNLIEKRVFPNLSFEAVDFEENQYDLSFVFFHYCTLATDIVICDRVYTHLDRKAEEQNEKIGFNDLTVKLSQFLDAEKLANQIKVYMVFRNVDFLLQDADVEQAYMQLNQRLKDRGLSPDHRRNIIYSLFTYLMFDHIGYDMRDMGGSMEHILGIDEDALFKMSNDEDTEVDGNEEKEEKKKEKKEEKESDKIDKAFIRHLKQRYIDIKGSEDHVFNADNLEDHIRARIGGQGQAFRMLLAQTGWMPESNDSFVPHVFFACTPITEDYRVYKNGLKSNPDQDEYDFYREGSSVKFGDMGSRACFGSYQLCMDIFNNHDIGSFDYGAMLQRICDIG